MRRRQKPKAKFHKEFRVMNLEPFLNEFYKTTEAKECCSIIRKYISQCDTVIEFGTRGGITAITILQGLIDIKRKFRGRFLGVDLISDESIVKISEIADKIGVSFQFWKGHTKDFPRTECDGFLWDTFHCAGNLKTDLNLNSPYIHKFIIIIGTAVDGERSEAVRRNLDTELVAAELRISADGVKLGLNSAIAEFLKENSEWIRDRDFGDITILKRIKPIRGSIFNST
jgi:hypothetical protein